MPQSSSSVSNTLVGDLLHKLKAEVDADLACFFEAAIIDSWPHYSNVQLLSDDDAVRDACARWTNAGRMPQGTALTANKSPTTLFKGGRSGRYLAPFRRNDFRLLDQEIDRAAMEAVPIYTEVYQKFECDQLRALVFNGRRFVGWVGLIRCGATRCFTRTERARLNRRMDEVKASLQAARSTRSGIDAPGGAHVLLSADDGRCTMASPRVKHWLTKCRLRMLQSAARAFAEQQQGIALIDGLFVRFARMENDDGAYILGTFEEADVLWLSPLAALSDAEFRVAELLKLGATVPEIARTLERSSNTVKRQVQSIYDRLQLGSRAEFIDLCIDNHDFSARVF